MEFSMEELVDLVETVGTRQTYLRKLLEPDMAVEASVVRDAVDELMRMDALRDRFLQEIRRLVRVKG